MISGFFAVHHQAVSGAIPSHEYFASRLARFFAVGNAGKAFYFNDLRLFQLRFVCAHYVQVKP